MLLCYLVCVYVYVNVSALYDDAVADLGGKQWAILCVALMVALGAGVGVGVPLALRSAGSSLQERLSVTHALLAQVPLIDG